MEIVSSNVQKMLSSNLLKEFAGEAWLLEKEGGKVQSLVGLAVFRGRRKDVSCGFESLDQIFDDEPSRHEQLAPMFEEEIEGWRKNEFGADFECLLDLVREEGTEGLARRLRCSQRRVQQRLKEIFEKENCAFQGDLFQGGAA